VGGDAKVHCIACASVVAKVVRDRIMRLLATRYPGYGWDTNAGYATAAHRNAIIELGLTPHHRRSFGSNRQLALELTWSAGA
jgi:ribonuclease HII